MNRTYRRRWYPLARWWTAIGLAVAAGPLLRVAILADHAADHELRLHGEHRSVRVVDTDEGGAKSPPSITVEVDGHRVELDTHVEADVGDTVVVAIGPGPDRRVLLADDREGHLAAQSDALWVPIFAPLAILAFGLGPGLPRYRAARAAVRRNARSTATILAKSTGSSPRGRVRREWKLDGSYWTVDLRTESGAGVRWRGCHGLVEGRVGETVTLLGTVRPGGWAVLRHGGPRPTYSWPDAPLEELPATALGGGRTAGPA